MLIGSYCPRDASLGEKLAFYSMPEPNSGCLLWLGGCDGHGHPWVEFRGKLQRAHRAAWEDVNGPIPDGLHALHKCDVRSCINVDHLFLGDQASNMADKTAKGRQSRGESHSIARQRAQALYRRVKAGDEQVLALGADTRLIFVIAADLGVSPRTVRLLRRRIAAHLSPVFVPAELRTAA